MNKKLEVVDFLRGFAIFTIALMHLVQGSLSGALNKAASFGGAGVHVFILVSGFGLYLSYMRKPLGYGEFLKKRFGKVYWPYAIMVVAWVLWILASSGSLLWREGLSHLLLYKMFDAELDVSLCYPFWFISTIIQFYICWPLIVRLARVGGGNSSVSGYGLLISGLISLGWATVVGLLGYEDMRPWGSCFLQYLWEFVLGMWLAQEFNKTKTLKTPEEAASACASENSNAFGSSATQLSAAIKDGSSSSGKKQEKHFFIVEEQNSINPQPYTINQIKWWWLIGGVVVGMGMTGVMGWIGGVLKLYNDIPSLMGYLSLLLVVYKVSCTFGWLSWIKKFFVWASGFGYELYLVHSLVYSISAWAMGDLFPLPVRIVVCFVMAYVVAYAYSWILKKR